MLATRSLPILIALTATVHAGASRAWIAARGVIPPDQELVAGANLANLRSGQLFTKLMPALLGKAGVSQSKLDAIKSTCGIDLVARIDSIVIAMETANKGTLVVAIKGTTRKDLEACGGKLATGDHTFSVTTAGTLTKYSGYGDQDIYVRWISSDAFAMSTEPDDKDQSLAATKGGFADKTIKPQIANLNTNAGIWAVARRAGDLPLTSISPKLAFAYGTINVAKGADVSEFHAVFDDADGATALAAVVSQQLAEAIKVPGIMAGLLQTATVKANGTQVVLTASPAESDVLPLLSMIMH